MINKTLWEGKKMTDSVLKQTVDSAPSNAQPSPGVSKEYHTLDPANNIVPSSSTGNLANPAVDNAEYEQLLNIDSAAGHGSIVLINTPSMYNPPIDSRIPLKLALHPLFDILICYSSTRLSLTSSTTLKLIQHVLIDDENGIGDNSPIMAVAWHRTSLTFAVGTDGSLLIFSNNDEEYTTEMFWTTTSSDIRLQLKMTFSLNGPCHYVFWLQDCLVTPSAPSDKSKPSPYIPSAFIFVWSGKFSTHANDPNLSNYSFKSIPSIRNNWSDTNIPLSRFVSLDSPSIVWNGITGVTLALPVQFPSSPLDSVTVVVRKVIPHPGSRMLALLHGIRLKNNSTVIPSSIVRVWSTHHTREDEKIPHDPINSRPGTKKKHSNSDTSCFLSGLSYLLHKKKLRNEHHEIVKLQNLVDLESLDNFCADEKNLFLIENRHDLTKDLFEASRELIKGGGIIQAGMHLVTLPHRIPVLDLKWKDMGVETDGVFIPAVLLTLTADNSIAIWLETNSENPLSFNCLITIRLGISPSRNFFSPIQANISMEHHSDLNRSLKQLNLLQDVGIISSPLDNVGIGFACLKSSSYSYDGFGVHNVMRVMKDEIRSQLSPIYDTEMGNDTFPLRSSHRSGRQVISLLNSTDSVSFLDFLFVTTLYPDFLRGADGSCGMWVYAIRDITNTGQLNNPHPLTRRILEPKHLPLPCQLRLLYSVEVIKTLGLPDIVWAQENEGTSGEPLPVVEGILLPACNLLGLTTCNQVVCIRIRCRIVSDNPIVQYHSSIVAIFGNFMALYHTLNPSDTRRATLTESELPNPQLNSLSTGSQDFGNTPNVRTRPISRLVLPYYKIIEEHFKLSFVLAVDNMGCLYVKCDDSVDASCVTLSSSVINDTYTIRRYDTGHFSTDKNVAPDNPVIKGVVMESFISLHSLPIERNKHILSGQILPPIRHALWLPFSSDPAIILAVAETCDNLIALEVKHSNVLPVGIRIVPCMGNVNHAVMSLFTPSTSDAYSLTFIDAKAQNDDNVLLLVRILLRGDNEVEECLNICRLYKQFDCISNRCKLTISLVYSGYIETDEAYVGRREAQLRSSAWNFPTLPCRPGVLAQCAFTTVISKVFIGLLACFPPLNGGTAKPKLHLSSNFSYIGIYELHGDDKLENVAFAAIPSGSIVSMAINEEWLAVLTEDLKLHFITLLDNSSIVGCVSLRDLVCGLHDVFHLKNVETSPASGVAAIRVLQPTSSFRCIDNLDILKQKISNTYKMFNEIFSSVVDSNTIGSDTKKKRYFVAHKANKLMPRNGTLPKPNSHIEFECRIFSQSLGISPILSFKRTETDGMLLLVNLGVVPDALLPLQEISEVQIRPEIVSLLFVRVKSDGIQTWEKVNQFLLKGNREWSLHQASWLENKNTVVVSTSRIPCSVSGFLDTCVPPAVVQLPPTALAFARVASAPRPIYHPASLFALLKRTEDLQPVLIVLKRLLGLMEQWRRGDLDHFPPSLGLPFELLSLSRESVFQDLEMRKHIISRMWEYFENGTLSTQCYRNEKLSYAEYTDHTNAFVRNLKGEYPEADISDLNRLLSYLTVEENIYWIDTHSTLCSCLSLLECYQLFGFISFVLPYIEQYSHRKQNISGNQTPSLLLNMAWGSILSLSDDLHPDPTTLASGRFLLAYHHTISLVSSRILLGQHMNQLKEEMPHLDYSKLFPSGFQSISSIDNPTDVVVIVPYDGEVSIKKPSMSSSDIAWSIFSAPDGVLWSRVKEIYIETARKLNVPNPKLTWSILRQAGAGYWLRDPGVAFDLATNIIPRDTYALLPVEIKSANHVALWYVVTGRLNVLRALYKQEKNVKILEFLSKDFSEEKSRTASIKNAFELVRQKRYLLSIAFFMIGGDFINAFDVCTGQLHDMQLALFLCTILEHLDNSGSMLPSDLSPIRTESGKLLKIGVIRNKIIPAAIKQNDVWLHSAALWLLGKCIDAVVVTIPNELKMYMTEIHNPEKHLEESNYVFSLKSINVWSYTSGSHEVEYDTGALRHNGLTPSLMLYRKHLLRTVEIQKVFTDNKIIGELCSFLQWFDRTHFSFSDSSYCFEECHTSKSSKNNVANSTEIISSRLVFLIIIIFEELLSTLDLGHSLKFSLSHRLPFQGLHFFKSLSDLKKMIDIKINKEVRDPLDDIERKIIGISTRQNRLIIRFLLALGFIRNVCDTFHLSRENLILLELDWMAEIMSDTVQLQQSSRVKEKAGKESSLLLVRDILVSNKYFVNSNKFEDWIIHELFYIPEANELFSELQSINNLINNGCKLQFTTFPIANSSKIISKCIQFSIVIPMKLLNTGDKFIMKYLSDNLKVCTDKLTGVLECYFITEKMDVQATSGLLIACLLAVKQSCLLYWIIEKSFDSKILPNLFEYIIVAFSTILVCSTLLTLNRLTRKSALTNCDDEPCDYNFDDDSTNISTFPPNLLWLTFLGLWQVIGRIKLRLIETGKNDSEESFKQSIHIIITDVVYSSLFIYFGVAMPDRYYLEHLDIHNISAVSAKTSLVNITPNLSPTAGSTLIQIDKNDKKSNDDILNAEFYDRILKNQKIGEKLTEEQLSTNPDTRKHFRNIILDLIKMSTFENLKSLLNMAANVTKENTLFSCFRVSLGKFIHDKIHLIKTKIMLLIISELPHFPLSLCQPPKNVTQDGNMTFVNCIILSFAKNSEMMGFDSMNFETIIQFTQISKYLELLLTRSLPSLLPSSLSNPVLSPNQLPVVSRVITNVKHTPMSFCLDSFRGLPHVPHTFAMGHYIPGIPNHALGLTHSTVGTTGIITISTNSSVYEVNLLQSVLLHSHVNPSKIVDSSSSESLTGLYDSASDVRHSHKSPHPSAYDDEISLGGDSIKFNENNLVIYEMLIRYDIINLFTSQTNTSKTKLEELARLLSLRNSVSNSTVGKSPDVLKRGEYKVSPNKSQQQSGGTPAKPKKRVDLEYNDFNLALELLLRGLLNPIGNAAVVKFETTSYQPLDRTYVTYTMCGLVTPPSYSFIPTFNPDSSTVQNQNERNNVFYMSSLITDERFRSQNQIVNIQLRCLPSLIPGNKPYCVIAPHPYLPICAGVIADSHVSQGPKGTVVISIWKKGEPQVKSLGVLAMWPIKQSKADSKTGDRATSHTKGKLTYSSSGPIKYLSWNVKGDKLVASHSKGWVSVWCLHDEIPITSNDNGMLDTNNDEQVVPDGFPAITFKPHTSTCRFAQLLPVTKGIDSVLLTSGKGLLPIHITCDENDHEVPDEHHLSLSTLPESGALCIWDMAGRNCIGPPVLIALDVNFEKGNFPTHFVTWAAAQCIIYGTKNGEIRAMSLNRVGMVSTLVESKHKAECEVVKIFLLKSTRRLVACYEDAMVRVWDVSWLQSVEYQENGHASSKIIQLLWESRSPLHSPDNSKLSLASSVLGVFNASPGSANSRSLLEAQMISEHHLLTLGLDGHLLLVRI